MTKFNAFTLAEVLITLVIIGVVAAITVPILNQNTNSEELVTRLKKSFSTFSQATDRIIMDEGPATEWAKDGESLYNMYKKYLNITKDCGSEIGCFEQGLYKHLDGNQDHSNWNNAGYFKFILPDGTQVMFSNHSTATSKDCNINNLWGFGSNNDCGYVWVDINGIKKPNQFGRDVFLFSIKENGLYPTGCDMPENCTNGSKGLACACRVITEGKFNY